MKFHGWSTLYEIHRGLLPRHKGKLARPQFYSNWVSDLNEDYVLSGGKDGGDPWGHWLLLLENQWYDQTRAYFKIWPAISQSLCKLNLKVALDSLDLSLTTVLIRTAVGNEFQSSAGNKLLAILITYAEMCENYSAWISEDYETEERALVCLSRWSNPEGNDIVQGWQTLSTPDLFTSVEKEIQSTHHIAPDIDTHLVYQVALTTLLLAKDPRIIKPEVLNKDRANYLKTEDPKYIRKAKTRGIVGWSIGEEYEKTPHYRRPHFGLRYTGKCGSIPRIVPIKGSVVYRDKLTRVPTGYITLNGVEVEPN